MSKDAAGAAKNIVFKIIIISIFHEQIDTAI